MISLRVEVEKPMAPLAVVPEDRPIIRKLKTYGEPFAICTYQGKSVSRLRDFVTREMEAEEAGPDPSFYFDDNVTSSPSEDEEFKMAKTFATEYSDCDSSATMTFSGHDEEPTLLNMREGVIKSVNLTTPATNVAPYYHTDIAQVLGQSFRSGTHPVATAFEVIYDGVGVEAVSLAGYRYPERMPSYTLLETYSTGFIYRENSSVLFSAREGYYIMIEKQPVVMSHAEMVRLMASIKRVRDSYCGPGGSGKCEKGFLWMRPGHDGLVCTSPVDPMQWSLTRDWLRILVQAQKYGLELYDV